MNKLLENQIFQKGKIKIKYLIYHFLQLDQRLFNRKYIIKINAQLIHKKMN